MLTLKDHVSGNVEFQYYRAGNLMYKTSTGLEFPVPISDTNDASFPRTEKGLLFMRWIRKQLDLETDHKSIKDCEIRSTAVEPFLSHSKHKFTP